MASAIRRDTPKLDREYNVLIPTFVCEICAQGGHTGRKKLTLASTGTERMSAVLERPCTDHSTVLIITQYSTSTCGGRGNLKSWFNEISRRFSLADNATLVCSNPKTTVLFSYKNYWYASQSIQIHKLQHHSKINLHYREYTCKKWFYNAMFMQNVLTTTDYLQRKREGES